MTVDVGATLVMEVVEVATLMQEQALEMRDRGYSAPVWVRQFGVGCGCSLLLGNGGRRIDVCCLRLCDADDRSGREA